MLQVYFVESPRADINTEGASQHSQRQHNCSGLSTAAKQGRENNLQGILYTYVLAKKADYHLRCQEPLNGV